MPNLCFNQLVIYDNDKSKEVFDYVESDTSVLGNRIDEFGRDSNVIVFDSAWIPADKAIYSLIRQFDIQDFLYEYNEENMGFFGSWAQTDNGLIEVINGDIPRAQDIESANRFINEYRNEYDFEEYLDDFDLYDDEDDKLSCANDYIREVFIESDKDRRKAIAEILSTDIKIQVLTLDELENIL